MTRNARNALICFLTVVISGLFISYKAFQLHQNQSHENQTEQSQRISQYTGQNLEQRLLQMEAAVSYLDKSTIETLKRMGARYFAYAYKKNGEWSIKWKKLGELGKQGILSEVNDLPFDELSEKKRHWQTAKNSQLIYIAPVKLAESHQLKEGFLIFGIAKEFFKELKSEEESYSLLDGTTQEIVGKLPAALSTDDLKEGESLATIEDLESGNLQLATAIFSPISQLWIVRSEVIPGLSFIGSSFFTYFLLTSVFALMLLLFLLMGEGRSSFSFSLPQINVSLPKFRRKESLSSSAASSSQDEEMTPISEEESIIEDFGDFLDSVLAEDRSRLKKIGVTLKTQVEEGARVICRRQHVEDFIKRLIGNSVLTLEEEKEKEIQLQLVEQSESYQMVYVDTRSTHFPSKQEATLMAQTEGSLEGIDGIISYARWMFGDRLTVAKKGFCLSIDVKKADEDSVDALVQKIESTPLQVTPLMQSIDRIEIDERDSEIDLIDGFTSFETTPSEISTSDEDESVDFDQFIEQFKMKEFSFQESQASKEETEPSIEPPTPKEEESVKTDDRGLFEFNSGQFKIKIRSPKKRDKDVDR